jgi:hypothetical protein
MMDLRRVFWIVALVVAVFIHTMLAGGLAVTLHSMVTVSNLAGVLLLHEITILLKGTAYIHKVVHIHD